MANRGGQTAAETDGGDPFQQLFGVSKDDLLRQGIDINSYVRSHILQAVKRQHPSLRYEGRMLYALFLAVAVLVAGLCVVAVGDHLYPRSLWYWLSVAPFEVGFLVTLGVSISYGVRAARARRREWGKEDLERTSFLPYTTKSALIGSTRLGFWLHSYGLHAFQNEVLIDGDRVRLTSWSGERLAECPVAAATVRPFARLLALGVRLDLGDQGHWFVQPKFDPLSRADELRAIAQLVGALHEAQLSTQIAFEH
jgi:hypothetical protein